MKKLLSNFMLMGLVVPLSFLAVGCTTSQMTSGRPALSLVEPATQQACIDEISAPEYVFTGKNKLDREQKVNFLWPWYVAIGGKIANESGVFERAAAGQIDQSTVMGLATRKYFLWSAHRSKALRVALRDPYDWNEIRKVLIEVTGEGNLLTKLTALPPEVIKKQIWGNNIPPEFFITGSLTEVTIGEESTAAGITFAGIGISGKVVQTSVAGSLEITDPYTGELVVSVMGQNRVTAQRIGAEGFRIISFDGREEYLNVEYNTAKEIIKQQVQVELVDFLFYKAFQKLMETNPDYLTKRLHYRAGRIQYLAKELAEKLELSDLSEATPIAESDESLSSISKIEEVEETEQASQQADAQQAEQVADEPASDEQQMVGSSLIDNDEPETEEIVDESDGEEDEQINENKLANVDEPADGDEPISEEI